MENLSRRVIGLALAAPLVILGACSDLVAANTTTKVSMQDQCDPVSFNAAVGTGSCTRQGTVTFAQFSSELAATQKVASWQFSPSALTIRVGQAITATNDGGEVHTFTEVAQFGGGIVPSLNSASGNPVEAPECTQLAAAAKVAPGTSFTTDVATAAGTQHYQCCIHPWMRATATVTG
jgi:plastocyanin